MMNDDDNDDDDDDDDDDDHYNIIQHLLSACWRYKHWYNNFRGQSFEIDNVVFSQKWLCLFFALASVGVVFFLQWKNRSD